MEAAASPGPAERGPAGGAQQPHPGRPRCAAERAAGALLRALGVDPDTESLRDTPRRMARAYAELLRPRRSI